MSYVWTFVVGVLYGFLMWLVNHNHWIDWSSGKDWALFIVSHVALVLVVAVVWFLATFMDR